MPTAYSRKGNKGLRSRVWQKHKDTNAWSHGALWHIEIYTHSYLSSQYKQTHTHTVEIFAEIASNVFIRLEHKTKCVPKYLQANK